MPTRTTIAPKEIFCLDAFKLMVESLGTSVVCQRLDVHPSTLRRWLRGAVPVPRVVSMALYWETPYGLSLADSDHRREIKSLYLRVRILEDQTVKAKDIITGLRRFQGDTANEPLFDDLSAMQASPDPAYGLPSGVYQAAVSGMLFNFLGQETAQPAAEVPPARVAAR